jgi:hypothetical protein
MLVEPKFSFMDTKRQSVLGNVYFAQKDFEPVDRL